MLQVAFQVDQQIAAGHQIQAGERGVVNQILPGKHHAFAHRLADPVAMVFAGKVAPQPVLGHIASNAFGVDRRAPNGQRPLVHIGGEDLQIQRPTHSRGAFHNGDGDAVSLLACGAAGHPHADRLVIRLLQQPLDHLLFQGLEVVRLAEELGDPDQQIVK